MSDNPFESKPTEPVPASAVSASPPPSGHGKVPTSAPGALTPILIFCIIFGVFGLIGTCMTGGVLVAMPALTKLIEEAPGVPESQKAFQQIQMAAQSSALIPAIILIVFNLAVAPMLIIGSIGCFKRKESSRNFLRMTLLLACVYSALKLIVTLYTTYASNNAVNAAIEKMVDDPLYQELKTQQAANMIPAIGGAAFSVVIVLAILGFYFWARSYLNKQNVIDHFASFNSQK